MGNIIAVLILALIVGAAALYVYKARKRGVKCIGCPGGSCAACNGVCACHTDDVR